MKRIYIVVLLCWYGINIAYGGEVPIKQAKEYAYDFMIKKTGNNLIEDAEISVFQRDEKTYTYIVNFEPKGWAIVSADDKAPAIIAYSLEGQFDPVGVKEMPFYFMIDDYKKQIKRIIEDDNRAKHATWNSVETSLKNKKAAISPLITVEWDQDAGYNAFCPSDADGPGGHAYAGCVAVAMAQCMSVYKYPERGYGTQSYIDDTYGVQFVDFSLATYNWSAFEDNTSNDDLALFLYHLGVSVDMDYDPDGSGALSSRVPGALKNHFDYTNKINLVQKADYTDEEWSELLINELKEGRPIYYAGDDVDAGHAFNVDGVNEQGLFHFNWGWGGKYNGYYSITTLTPGSGDYSTNQEAVINIAPRDHDPYDIELTNNSIQENLPENTEVGILSALDETLDDTHSFVVNAPADLFGNPGTVPFIAQDDKLITTEVLDYSKRVSYEIIVEATDLDNNTFEKTFLIFVTKEPEVTSIESPEKLNDFKIHKSGNHIIFSFANNYHGKYDINITDLSGKHIVKNTFYKASGNTSGDLNLEFKNYSGLYLITFDFKESKFTKKIVFD